MNCSASSETNPDLPELNIRGRVYDNGSTLTLCCGRCGSEVPITKVADVRVYAHAAHMLISFDIAHMVKQGEYSLLCDACATAEQPALAMSR